MKLKWIGLGAVLMAAVLLLIAAVPISEPTLYNFDRRDFTIDDSITPTVVSNIIQVHLRSDQFSHDANGITLTNVGSSIGTGTSNTIPVWTGSNTLGNSVFFKLNANAWAGGTNFVWGFNDGSFSIVKTTGSSTTQFRIEDYSNFPDTALTEMTANSFYMQPRTNRNYSFDVTKTTAGQGVVFQFANANPILTLSSNENVIVGNTSADPTRSTNYFYIPMSDGVPTGIPNNESGRPALVYDTNNSVLYSYNAGSWHAISGGSGGIGNVINTGPSVVNMVPVYTDTSGTQVTPTNSLNMSGTVSANAVVSSNLLQSLTPSNPQTVSFSHALGLTYWLVATGDVVVASSVLDAGSRLLLNIDNPQATNINVVTPIGWRPVSGAGVPGVTPGTNILAASKIGVLSAISRAANDTNVVSLWSSE